MHGKLAEIADLAHLASRQRASRSRFAVLLLCAVAACAAPSAEERTAAEAANSGSADASDTTGAQPLDAVASSESSLRLLVEPFPDLYFLVRAQAAGVEEIEPEMKPIVEAWMPVQEEVGGFGGFWMFDLPGLESRSPQDFKEAFADAREEVPSRAGGTIPVRGPGLAMAEAMADVWPSFRDQRWPQRGARLGDVVTRLEREFLPRHQEALGHMLTSLGIDDPAIEVPTYLVLDAHPPGATTYRSSTGPVFVLSTRDLLGEGRFSDLSETILHEACHVLDLASEGEDDALSTLRRLLVERGVDRQRADDLTHLVMFAQAENTMRRLFDPEHVAYGDTRRGDIAPLYERWGRAADVVRAAWSDYLDGEITRAAAVERIADELTS